MDVREAELIYAAGKEAAIGVLLAMAVRITALEKTCALVGGQGYSPFKELDQSFS